MGPYKPLRTWVDEFPIPCVPIDRDSWMKPRDPMYPYMGNPYDYALDSGYLWVIIIPKNPKVEHNKYR